MESKSLFGSLVVSVLVAVTGVLFIRETNDHQECTTVKTTNVTPAGCSTVTDLHVCRETFNL